ncbi:uncharacterized protein LOC135392790 [Ornithodoros turicata]|uniref:uncharacterized protein LOC135392790 n=1 Tax=Ornithodoros turicata TaxID=34597 RepID=UPI003138701B
MGYLRGWVPFQPMVFYVLLSLSDKLQAPYEYDVYRFAHLPIEQITYVFAGGAIASLLADVFARPIARRVGWKISGALLLLMLVHSCVLKYAEDPRSLITSKILARVGLITIFPLAVGQFHPLCVPGELFVILTIGVTGMLAGFVGTIVCDIVYFQPTQMFFYAYIVLIATLVVHGVGGSSQPIKRLTPPGFQDPIINNVVATLSFAFWTTSTVVEMYWSPLCRGTALQVGMVYAIFCLCQVLGNCTHKIFVLQETSYRYALTMSTMLASIGMFFAFVGCFVYAKGTVVFIMSLFTYHFAVGMLGSVMRNIRCQTSVSSFKESVCRSLGRVAGAGLILYGDLSELKTRNVFMVLFVIMFLTIWYVQFQLAEWKRPKTEKVLRVYE